jgi:hypothetical protein
MAKKLHYIDLKKIDTMFDSYEQEIFNTSAIALNTSGVKHAELGVWCDPSEQKLCGFNKKNLAKVWADYKQTIISGSKEMGWYGQDAAMIDRLFDQKIHTLA